MRVKGSGGGAKNMLQLDEEITILVPMNEAFSRV